MPKEEALEEEAHIHIKISKRLKAEWKEGFKQRGHNTLTSGITAAVFYYLNLLGAETMENTEFLSKIKRFLETMERIDHTLQAKIAKVKTLDYDLPSLPAPHQENKEEIRQKIIEQIETYGAVGITFLADTLAIEGQYLMAHLKHLEREKVIKMNKDYEWVLR